MIGLALLGCAAGTVAPAEVPMSDGQPESQDAAFADLRALVILQPAAWSGRAEYNPTDPALLDPVLRKVVDQRNFGKVPATHAERERLAYAISNSVWAGQLARPEWRAAVQAKVEAWWAAPLQTTSPDGGVTLDLGLCPGPITAWSGGKYGITTSEHVDRSQLRREVVAERLAGLAAAHPTAPWLELRVQVPVGHRSPETYRYRYDPLADVLYVLLASQEGTVWVSPEPLHGDLGSLATTHPTRTDELKPLRRGRDVPAF
jgi:hypothetical protein